MRLLRALGATCSNGVTAFTTGLVLADAVVSGGKHIPASVASFLGRFKAVETHVAAKAELINFVFRVSSGGALPATRLLRRPRPPVQACGARSDLVSEEEADEGVDVDDKVRGG